MWLVVYMGCACLRDEETNLPKSQDSDKHYAKTEPAGNSQSAPNQRRASVTKKLQLGLPNHSSDVDSSPGNGKSPSPSNSVQRRKSVSATPRSTTPRGNEINMNPAVRLRDIRVVSGGVESCYKLGKGRLGSFVLAEHKETKKKCWIVTYVLLQGTGHKK